MPESNVQFLPRTELLTFEELTRFVSVVASCGVNKLRLTGGEPLVRSNLSELVGQLAKIDGIQDIALTTNGLLLADYAQPLFDAGLHRLNVSLDGLSEATFQKISRRSGLDKVLAGIDKAIEMGFQKIRLNAVSIAGITEPEIIPLARFARAKKLELRFIEFMPLDADKSWASDQVLSGEKIKAMIESEIGSLVPAERLDKSQPSMDFDFADGNGRIGFINPISQPFCSDCNRIRITAEGKFRNCLFSTSEWDLRKILREGGTDADIEAAVRDSIGQKKATHGIDSDAFVRPEKAMFQIGG
jgi:cyclic pyranopterin phosphate synthase